MLLLCFHCYGNLKLPLNYNGKSENWPLLLSHCKYCDKSFTEMFSFFFSIVAIATERLKCWQSFFSCLLKWTSVAYGPLVFISSGPLYTVTVPYTQHLFSLYFTPMLSSLICIWLKIFLCFSGLFYNWATSWENLFLPYANNKGADQPGIRAVWSVPLLFAT